MGTSLFGMCDAVDAILDHRDCERRRDAAVQRRRVYFDQTLGADCGGMAAVLTELCDTIGEVLGARALRPTAAALAAVTATAAADAAAAATTAAGALGTSAASPASTPHKRTRRRRKPPTPPKVLSEYGAQNLARKKEMRKLLARAADEWPAELDDGNFDLVGVDKAGAKSWRATICGRRGSLSIKLALGTFESEDAAAKARAQVLALCPSGQSVGEFIDAIEATLPPKA
jgi:hypothetical protein